MGDNNAERAVRYLHEATQGEEGADGTRQFSCRWFLDRSFFCVSTSVAAWLVAQALRYRKRAQSGWL